MGTLLGKLGTNFLTAAFVPSLWFVISFELLFSRLDPAGPASIIAPPQSLLEDSLITLVFTLVIGLTLMGLNTFLYKLLEGYYVLGKLSPLWRRQLRKYHKRQQAYEARERLEKHLLTLVETEQDEERRQRRSEQLNELQRVNRDLKAAFKQDYPSRVNAILPTRFGNILKSAELYANENYAIDSVTMWPRLIHVIAPQYYRKLDDSNNGLAFTINCMVLAFTLSVLCLSAWGYRAYQDNSATSLATAQALQVVGSSADSGQAAAAIGPGAREEETRTPLPNPLLYLGGAVFFAGVGWFFYNASLPAARQYGNLFRSAFDLFRFNLLAQLHLPLPENETEEYEIWNLLSGFMALGELDAPRDNRQFSYVHPDANRPKPGEEASD